MFNVKSKIIILIKEKLTLKCKNFPKHFKQKVNIINNKNYEYIFNALNH